MFKLFYRQKPWEIKAHALYETCVNESRELIYFEELGVKDNFECRFEVQTLIVSLVVRRLRLIGTSEAGAIAQSLFDEMFAVMDLALREQGVGDLKVGKHIKRMIGAYYGRSEAYEMALGNRDFDALREAIVRNVYGGEGQSEPVASIVDRVIRFDSLLTGVDDSVFVAPYDGQIFKIA